MSFRLLEVVYNGSSNLVRRVCAVSYIVGRGCCFLFAGGWVLRSDRGQLRRTGSTSTAPPATSKSTFPRQHQGPKDLSILQCDIHLIEIKYCEEIRPQNQPCAAQEQHKGLCTFLQDLPLPSTPSYWERVGGTI